MAHPPTAENLIYTLEEHAREKLEGWGVVEPYTREGHRLFDEVRAEGLARWQVEHGGDPEWAEGLRTAAATYQLLGVGAGADDQVVTDG